MSCRKAARSLSREENLQGKPLGPWYKGQYDDVDTLQYFQYLTVPECNLVLISVFCSWAIAKGI